MFKKHNLANAAQRYAIGNQCRGCLKTYHRDQLIHHLKYFKTGCLVKLSVLVPELADEELEQIQQDLAVDRAKSRNQQRRGAHKWPVVQAAGPIRPWPWVRRIDVIHHDRRPLPALTIDQIQQWVELVMFELFTCDVGRILAALDQQPYHGTLRCFVHSVKHTKNPSRKKM